MEVKADGKKILSIFERKVTYVVPDYQRPYSWTKDQIEDLFNDLEEAIDSDSNHYFGAFVFNVEKEEDENIIEIIDGQQRLTTIATFLYVLNYIYNLDKYKNLRGMEHRRSKLKECLEFLNADGETEGLKLQLGEVNKDFYNEYIVKGWNKNKMYKEQVIKEFKDKGKYNASKLLKEAFDTILNKIYEKIEDLEPNDAILIVKKYQDTLLERFEVVEIRVKQDADAFLIFETLNDRGLALSQVDLIKNKLFKNCASNDGFENVKSKWVEMIELLEDVSIVKRYLRHYWIATYEHISHQNLFKSVREKIGNNFDISKNIIYDLNKMSPYYEFLLNPTSGIFTNKKLIRTLVDMNKLNFDLTHPILLSAFKYYRDDENTLYKVARLCLNFLIRYITILKGKPTRVEKVIGECARELRNNINVISEKLKEYARDSEFKESMRIFIAKYRSPVTYFILTEYEKTLHNEEWIPPERTSITVEHILPRNVDFTDNSESEWKRSFTKEQHEIYLNRLGNLTLLGQSPQSRASNKSFSEKKRVYAADTDMKMTQELCNYENWTVKEIEERQNKIAEICVDIFTLDINKII